jgi:surface antigen
MSIILNKVNRARATVIVLGASAAVAFTPGSALASHRSSPHRHVARSGRRHEEIPGRGGAGCAVDGGGYCVGQCVDFVWSKRPELSHLGNATDWLAGAQRRGIPTGHTPVVGAVAWWSGVDRTYADSVYGHVAYVELSAPAP